MHILIAPDKFKGSLEAAEVAASVAKGLAGTVPGVQLAELPVADGGEGTVDAAVSAGFDPVTVTVSGPTGNPVAATFAHRHGVAVIEMAAASGLAVLPRDQDGTLRLDPRGATSAGTGELIRAALDLDCRDIVLGVGGSAGTDGGAGLLTALGARLTNAGGEPLAEGGGALQNLDQVDLSGLDPRLAEARFVLAADVTNPLLGPFGAAAVFGPQKGATPGDVEALDRALARFAGCVAEALGADPAELTGLAGAGAAGGVGFAALTVLRAELRPGIDVVLDLVELDAHLSRVDVVVTGEGSLDGQSLGGKTPVGVARRARARGVDTVIAVCGRSLITADEARAAGFDEVYALADREPDPTVSMRDAARLLEHVGSEIGRRLTSSSRSAARSVES